MSGFARWALVSSLWLVAACSNGGGAEPSPVNGGAAGATAGGSQGGTDGKAGNGGGTAGSTVSSTAGDAGAPAAGSAGAPAAGSAGATAQGGAAGEGGTAQAGAAGADTETSDVQTILDTYRSFAPQTATPVNVSSYIFGLCRMPTLRETEFVASIHGDGRYLQDWANPLAVQGLASRGVPAFPEGAVIVKEKYAGPQASEANLVAIGLMIKRRAGFDPARGDWDYAYYEPALGIVHSAEQTAYCGNCHAGAAATDSVFVDGLTP